MAIFGLSGETDVTDENSNIEEYMQKLGALTSFGDRLDQDPLLDGGGMLEQVLFGGVNSGPEDRNGVQSLLRGVTSAIDPELGAARAGRRQLTSFSFKEAYDDLRGAGQITEFESRTAAGAQDIFNNEDATDEQLQREVMRVRDTFEAAQFRNEMGIKVSDRGLETLNGVPVLTWRDENGNFQYSENPGGEEIYNIPDWLDESSKDAAISSLPPGVRYFYKGELETRE